MSDAQGKLRLVTANREGFFRARNLAPGRYLVLATAPGFAPSEDVPVEIVAGRTRTLEITLEVAPVEEEVNVEEDQEGLSVEPDSNVGAIILREEDLEAFSDDPEDLRAELEALAGPGAGPDGAEFYIDGFSGGQLPPKASIREIRINSDPFSAEYDRLGFGRIQILTKPGTAQFRGRASFGFSDESLNSRNPFAPNRPPYQSRLYGANLSGPVNKKSSFFIDFQRREIDNNAVINATVLDPALNPIGFSEAVVTPSRRTNVGPRLDYQLSENHTLTSRYRYFRSGNDNSGVGGFSLFDLAYDTVREGHTLQVSETAVLNDRTVNETRLQFTRNTSTSFGDIALPLISVRESFRTGSNQVGQSG
ncbi:MAG: TonB-dependent receptor, partial [Acidobacteria bacterium]|nr:TonB-dependent receptor [Acidobacteriota bacterium]